MTTEKKGFVDSVVSFLKLDDEGKVAKFQKQSLKIITKQIVARKEQLADLRDQQVEYSEEKTPEVILNVDVNAIKSIDDRKDYFTGTYLPAIQAVIEQEDAFNTEIEELEDQIEVLERIAEKLA